MADLSLASSPRLRLILISFFSVHTARHPSSVMIFKESGKKPIFAVALILSFVFSLIFLQRRHDLSLPTTVDSLTNKIKKPSSTVQKIVPPGAKQIKLPEASIKALQNETLGVRSPARVPGKLGELIVSILVREGLCHQSTQEDRQTRCHTSSSFSLWLQYRRHRRSEWSRYVAQSSPRRKLPNIKPLDLRCR